MQTTVKNVTPKMALEILNKHLVPEHQRKLSEAVVESYACIMRAGQWLLTHQGIAIDETGELIDGQHRLRAIVASGVTVPLMVTTGIPHNGNETGVLTIDAIDRGTERGVGAQLQLRHGISNGNLTAGAFRGVLWLAANSVKIKPGKFYVGAALRVNEHYGNEIKYCVEHRSRDKGVRNAAVIAACAFAMKACNEQVRDFYHKLTTGENIASGDPAMTARRWLMNTDSRGGTLSEYRGVLICAMKHVNQEQVKTVFNSENGYNYFLSKQRATVNKLLRECGFVG